MTTTIDLDITDGCNLACGYCFKKLDHPNNMSVRTAKDAIEWLILASGPAGEIGVNFMGGEPVLRFDSLREIVRWGTRRCRSLGKRVHFSLTSNMTLWTDEVRKWVDDVNVGVLMSVDGLPEVQDAQRPAKDGRPKADIVAYWARSMLRTRPGADARLTTVPRWIHKLHDSVLYLWEQIGFQSIVMADADYENWTDEHVRIYRRQNEEIADYLFKDFQGGGNKSIAIYSFFLKRLIRPKDRGEAIQRRRFPCGAGYNYCMIDYRGDIWPCHRFDGAAKDSCLGSCIKLGNIYEGKFNEELSNAFRNFDHFATAKPECASCPLDAVCGGFCPAANLQHMRDSIYQPHPAYCQLKQILYPIVEDLYRRMKEADPDRLEKKMAETTIGMVEV